MRLTPEAIDNIVLGNAPVGRRGYAKAEVDAFLRRISRTLAGEDDLTAAEVHHMEFSRTLFSKHAYAERDVDDVLDQAEDELMHRGGSSDDYRIPPTRGPQERGTYNRQSTTADTRRP